MERDADKKDWLMIEQQIICPMCGSKARLEEYENDMYIDRIKKKIKFKMVSYLIFLYLYRNSNPDTTLLRRIRLPITS